MKLNRLKLRRMILNEIKRNLLESEEKYVHPKENPNLPKVSVTLDLTPNNIHIEGTRFKAPSKSATGDKKGVSFYLEVKLTGLADLEKHIQDGGKSANKLKRSPGSFFVVSPSQFRSLTGHSHRDASSKFTPLEKAEDPSLMTAGDKDNIGRMFKMRNGKYYGDDKDESGNPVYYLELKAGFGGQQFNVNFNENFYDTVTDVYLADGLID